MSVSESGLRPGRLGPFVAGFRVWLLERGYALGTLARALRFLGALGRWMLDEGLEVGQLDGDVVVAFVDAHRAEGRSLPAIARGSRALLIYLRELGCSDLSARSCRRRSEG